VEPRPVIVPPGEGHRIGNVEYLARTVDTQPLRRMLNIHAPAGFDRRIGL
jgi:hypothetical protein